MKKKYLIGKGKDARYWLPNIVSAKGILPLRIHEIEIGNHCLDTKERVFGIEALMENKYPPHELGDIVFFTESQIESIIKQLQKKRGG